MVRGAGILWVRGELRSSRPTRDHMTPFSAWARTGAVPAERGWSEQTLLSLVCGEHATPLQTRWPTLLSDLCALGVQHVVTTNRVGALGFYAPLAWHHDGDGTRLAGDGVAIKLDTEQLTAAFATGTPRSGMLRRTTRLFDRHGDPLLVMATTPFGHTRDFDAFVRRHQRPVTPPQPQLAPLAPAGPADSAPRGRLAAALADWKGLTDARAFEELLIHHGLNRSQLYAAADDDLASVVNARELIVLLRWMVDRQAPISLQVGRCGVVTSARVTAEELTVAPKALELAGGNAVLRLALQQLGQIWLVQHPGLDGTSHQSIQLLDSAGELAACIGGAEQWLAAGVWGWTRQAFRPGAPA